ncbi:MAG: hypothetical protein WD336_10845, partial [Trueperaceae bacterium]
MPFPAGHGRASKMPRRSLTILLLLLATLVLAAALLPATPWARERLLDVAAGAADGAGYAVSWEASGGNPWRALTLSGLRVVGPGLNVHLEDARLGWFAPALLTGELPLWIGIDGADVAVDVGGFPAGDPDATGRGLPVQPELRELDLHNLRVTVDDVPYTLPDLRLEDLSVGGQGRRLQASGRVATPDGALTFDADVGLDPFRLDAEVRDAHVRIARQWWDGAQAGQVDGTVRWIPDRGLEIRADIRDGAIDWYDLQVDQLQGPVRMDGGLIQAELSGVGMGGPVAVNGRVDVANARWSATLHGTPDLATATAWISPVALPGNLVPQGEALVTAHAAGWTQVDVRASAQGTGTLDGRPFTLRSDEVRFATGPGLSIEGHGAGFGGRWAIDAREREGALTWVVRTEDATFGPAHDLDGELRFRTGADGGGTFRLTGAAFGEAGYEAFAGTPAPGDDRPPVTAEALPAVEALAPPPPGPAPVLTAPGERSRDGRDVTFQIDGEITGGTLSAFVDGRAYGGTLQGAAALQGGEVDGTVRLTELAPWLSGPEAIELTASGPVATPTLRMSLTSPESVPLPREAVPGLALLGTDVEGRLAPLDLRGSLSARLEGATLHDVDGRFGPWSVRGRFPFAAAPDAGPDGGLDGAPDDAPPLRWTLAPVRMHLPGGPDGGPNETAAGGSLIASIANGTFDPLRPDGSRLTGDLTLDAIDLAGVRSDPLRAQLRATLPFLSAGPNPQGATIEAEGPALQATFADGRLDLRLRDHPVTLAGTAEPLTGTLAVQASLDASDPLGTVRGAARFAADGASVTATADDGKQTTFNILTR